MKELSNGWIDSLSFEGLESADEEIELTTPAEVMSLSNPTLSKWVEYWQAGDCSWEEAMQSAAYELAVQNMLLVQERNKEPELPSFLN
jgi:hypothetical protein